MKENLKLSMRTQSKKTYFHLEKCYTYENSLYLKFFKGYILRKKIGCYIVISTVKELSQILLKEATKFSDKNETSIIKCFNIYLLMLTLCIRSHAHSLKLFSKIVEQECKMEVLILAGYPKKSGCNHLRAIFENIT